MRVRERVLLLKVQAVMREVKARLQAPAAELVLLLWCESGRNVESSQRS